MFRRSAYLYDKLYHFKDYAAHSEKLVAAMRDAHPAASTLLEVACGTGQFLAHLRKHYRVEGLDVEPTMLAAARERLPDVALHCADMTDFNLQRRFDVVACLFSSVAYVKTATNLYKTIDTLARHLSSSGILVVEPFFTPESYWVDRVTMNVFDEEALKIAWMYVSERSGPVARLNINYVVGTPKGVSHFTELHELGLFSHEQYVGAFAGAGLDVQHDPIGPAGRGLYVGVAKQ